MKLRTKYFHDIDYQPEDILRFPNGLFGFEDEKEFLLLPFAGSDGTLLSLQSVQTPALAFVVMNPFALRSDYAPQLPPDQLQQLQVERSQELCFYVLCVVREPVGESTVNLKCPVAVNIDRQEAMQVILDTQDYHMRHKLADLSAPREAVEEC